MHWRLLPLLITAPALLFAHDRIAHIEFFGYGGIDLRAVRQSLPFHEGDALRPEFANQARSAVRRVLGRDATDVDIVCCTANGDSVVFIGLPGASTHPLTFDPAPQGDTSPSAQLQDLYATMTRLETESVGKSLAVEDGAPGYRLSQEPATRAAELALRAYVMGHETAILDLTSSSDAAHRAMAVDALGFGAGSPRRIAALVRATRDPDAAVRNNATRALFEILRGDPSAATQIQPDRFIQMLHSGTWTDRNKASGALLYLTRTRDPALLARVKSEAGDALEEMANWHGSWAIAPRVVLARISGDPDLSAYLGGLPLSLWQGAAICAIVSALFALLFVRLRSKGAAWALAVITPAAVSVLLYWILLRIGGTSMSEFGIIGLVFILAWGLAAMAASLAVVIARFSRTLRTD